MTPLGFVGTFDFLNSFIEPFLKPAFFHIHFKVLKDRRTLLLTVFRKSKIYLFPVAATKLRGKYFKPVRK